MSDITDTIMHLRNVIEVLTAERDSFQQSYEDQCRYVVALKTDVEALYDSAEKELIRLRLEKQEATAAFNTMHRLYFSQVSGYDDVPSSKPDNS